MLYQISVSNTHGEVQESHTKKINLKYLDQHGIKNLNYLMNHVYHIIIKTVAEFWILETFATFASTGRNNI